MVKLTDEVSARCIVVDIECMAGLFYVGCFDGKDYFGFEISHRKNQLYEFVKWYTSDEFDYTVSFNGIGYDMQVLQYVVENYESWFDSDGQSVVDAVYKFSQETIYNKNHGVVTYRDNRFSKPPIDVFTMLGFDNANRYTSLKHLQASLDMPSVEEMPIHYTESNLSSEQIDSIIHYCKNDLVSTWTVFELTLGKTEHPLYKNNNQIQIRFDNKTEFGLDCLSYSDIKIGDEMLKMGCMQEMKVSWKDFPRKGTFRRKLALKECIPSYIKFETPELNKVLSYIKNRIINPLPKKDETGKKQKEFELNFKFDGTEYTLGLGGGHSVNSNEAWYQDDLHFISDLDTSSQYPATAIEFEYYPYHLRKVFGKVYKPMYDKRIELKPLSKKDSKIKGICDNLKMALNVPTGKFRETTSWMYDAKAAISICLTSQMVLLMLIEKMSLEGIHCFSFNTDGATFRVPYSKEKEFYAIIKDWEKLTNFILEEQRFEYIKYLSVNDYIGKKVDGTLKTKGDCCPIRELHKNPSERVISFAIEEYYKTGTNPVDFIKNHKNIYDFCILGRAKGDFYLEEVNDSGYSKVHNKILRYYISNDGNLLFKRGYNKNDKAVNAWVHAPSSDFNLKPFKITNFNRYVYMKDYDINYDYYIVETLKLLDRLEGTRMKESYLKTLNNTSQLSLF